MNHFKLYNTVLVSMISLLGIALLIYSQGVEPYDGDLTRTGGYPETDFGWNGAKPFFGDPLFTYANKPSDYDRYYDVVVLGDSFSKDQHRGWQNYLANMTGMSIITFHVDRFTVDDLLAHVQYQSTQPTIVIYQTVERLALPRLSRENKPFPNQRTLTIKPLKQRPLGVTPQMKGRTLTASTIDRINVASDLLTKTFLRETLGLNLSRPTTKRLKRRLFSSAKGDELLFIKSHLHAGTLSLNRLEDAEKGALSLQRRVESNGLSKFYLLIFPNKLSVYREELADKTINVASLFDHIERLKPYNLVSVFYDLQQAVRQGEQDVYFSNDTHISTFGYRLSAQIITQQFHRDAVLQ